MFMVPNLVLRAAGIGSRFLIVDGQSADPRREILPQNIGFGVFTSLCRFSNFALL
jgi:hypothetical protein